MNRRRFLCGVAAAGILGTAGCNQNNPAETPTSMAEDSKTQTPSKIFVDADQGSKHATGNRENPLHSIQAAIQQAKPGTIVHVLPGRYHEVVKTVRSGEPENPIRITGPPDAVYVGGDKTDRPEPFKIRHSHIHITGLTFDGLQNPQQPDAIESYAKGNIDIKPPIRSGGEFEFPESGYLQDIVVKPYAVGNTRGGMIGVHWTKNIEIGEFKLIGPAGLKHSLGDTNGHNGEVIYFGTPLAKWNQTVTHKKGTPVPPPFRRAGLPIDESHHAHIHHIDNSDGYVHAELVDVKAGAYDVTIEYCTDAGGGGMYRLPGRKPTAESAISIGGRRVTLRWCIISNSHGNGVEVGSWSVVNPEGLDPSPSELSKMADEAGRHNAIYGNRIVDNYGLAIKFVKDNDTGEIADRYGPDDQRVICGNTVTGRTHGNPEKSCPEGVPEGHGIGHTEGSQPRPSTSERSSVTETTTLSQETNALPIPRFTYSPQNPKVGETVRFNASSSEDPDGDIVKFQWSFKEEGAVTIHQAEGRQVEMAFQNTGKYGVILTVIDDKGAANTTKSPIQVVGGG